MLDGPGVTQDEDTLLGRALRALNDPPVLISGGLESSTAALPFTAIAWAVRWRTDALAAAGLQPPGPDWTLDDFRDACAALSALAASGRIKGLLGALAPRPDAVADAGPWGGCRMAGEAVAVEFRGLCRSFGGRQAVRDLDLQVPVGSVFGFLGPNGAGKTTTVRMMLGMLAPTAGTIRVLGLDPVRGGARGDGRAPRSGGTLRPADGSPEPGVGRARCRPSPARAHPPGGGGAAARGAVGPPAPTAFRATGMRQKLGVARALLADPRLIVLDEPMAALDPANIVMVRDLLLSLAQEGGRTIFLCTLQLDEA